MNANDSVRDVGCLREAAQPLGLTSSLMRYDHGSSHYIFPKTRAFAAPLLSNSALGQEWRDADMIVVGFTNESVRNVNVLFLVTYG